MVIYLKTNLDSVLILQKWCLCIITFSFHIAHNNLLFSDLKILRFHILISAGTKSLRFLEMIYVNTYLVNLTWLMKVIPRISAKNQ